MQKQLTNENVAKLLPIGSSWASAIVWHNQPENVHFDGVIRITEHDQFTSYMEYGMDHKNGPYDSRLLGKRGDWSHNVNTRYGSESFYRDTPLARVLFVRVADGRFNAFVPERVPVCSEYACDCKIGPIAEGFPASY